MSYILPRLFCFACLVCLGTGCASSGDSVQIEEQNDFLIRASLDRSVYRPGQIMLVAVSVINNSGRMQNVRALDAGSIEVHFRMDQTDETLSHEPVVSRLERKEIGRVVQLAPGEKISRTFMLTLYTRFAGEMHAQVHYDPSPPYQQLKMEKVFSNVLDYEVAGKLMFERDTDGLILQKEAERLACEKAGGRMLGSESVAIFDEMGFARYWVNVAMSTGGQDRTVSYFVDPYVGRVWAQAKPFPKSMLLKERMSKDPRAKRSSK